MIKDIYRKNGLLVWALVLLVLGYILIHDLQGGTLFRYDYHDSYTLQALSWRQGRTDLGQNYEYLELAIYNGKYYVSFPPLPSVVMLPLTIIFGNEPPSNIVVMVYVLVSVVFAYLSIRKMGGSERVAIFWAVTAVMATNVLWISTMGGAWFMAQAMNLMLCLMAVYFALCNKRMPALAMAALAVGCRPFSAVFVLILLAMFLLQDMRDEAGFATAVISNLKNLVLPIIIALIYMWYNYIRFDNLFEFGHNYLPEFSETGSEQFGTKYILTHLKNLFFRGVKVHSDGTLEYTHFDGFMFYLSNPIFLLWFVYLVADIYIKQLNSNKILLTIGFVLNLIALTMHKTFGGWQFGARYTIDLIPYAFMYIAMCRTADIKRYQLFAGAWGIMFNLYGFAAFLSQSYW